MSRCLGCGVELQTKNQQVDGYVSDLSFNICERCFMIKNYGKNKIVQKTNVDYMEILNNICDDSIVVYVSSLLTMNLEYINKFKNVILVLTKRDILPKSIKDGKIINYVKERYHNIMDVLVVSAYKKMNLDSLYDRLNKEGKNKKIYFVGITNSGKSTLINEMIKSYNGLEGAITTSNFPSTTLGIVDVTIGDLKVYDTPGIVIEDSIINTMDTKGIKKINSKKEIKPITFQIEGNGAILVDEYVRIEYSTTKSSMTFYMSNNLNISNISLKNSRLSDGIIREYDIPDGSDLVIEDLGFIKVTKNVLVKLYLTNDIYIYLRDKLV